MESIPVPIFVAVGAITAAFIAGFFSFLNLAMSKEQKVSEFRQEWINNLREEIAEYISAISFYAWAYNVKSRVQNNDKNISEFHESLEDTFSRASKYYTLITLRINPDDKDKRLKELNSDFLRTLNKVRDSARSGDWSSAISNSRQLDLKAQPILKHEWERVKRGEPGFRAARYTAIGILVLCILAVGLLSHHIVTNMKSPSITANQGLKATPKNDAP
jgi:hypothetical protein